MTNSPESKPFPKDASRKVAAAPAPPAAYVAHVERDENHDEAVDNDDRWSDLPCTD